MLQEIRELSEGYQPVDKVIIRSLIECNLNNKYKLKTCELDSTLFDSLSYHFLISPKYHKVDTDTENYNSGDLFLNVDYGTPF